jgi:hypothetical protein
MSLSEVDVKNIADALDARLDKRRSIDEATHKEDHEFVRGLIRKERERKEFWLKVKQQVGGWSVVVVLTGIGAAVWNYLVSLIHNQPN